MMKKILFAVIATSAALSGVAQAEDGAGAYIGAGVTASRYKFDVPGAVSSDNSSGTKAAGKVFAGYDFNKMWAVEGGYTDFGSKNYNYGNGSVSTDSHSLYVAGKATLPVNEQVSVYGKLGVVENHDSISGTGTSAGLSGDNKTGLYASVGAQYAINKKVSLIAEYENYGKSADFGRKASALSIGARYNF